MENSENKNQENQKQVNPPNRFAQWLKTSITARMLMVGALILVLLIPLTYVNILISERAYRQQDVVNEINQKWGNEVMLYGPILKLPYKTYSETSTFNEKTKTYLKASKLRLYFSRRIRYRCVCKI